MRHFLAVGPEPENVNFNLDPPILEADEDDQALNIICTADGVMPEPSFNWRMGMSKQERLAAWSPCIVV